MLSCMRACFIISSNPTKKSLVGIEEGSDLQDLVSCNVASNPTKKPLVGIEEGIDRISDLPDLVLCKILSFLPTKYAMAASVLSKRWGDISPFHIHPINISLDDRLLLHPVKNEVNPGVLQSYSQSFVDFVDKLLNTTLKNVSCVERMSLDCHKYANDACIASWISAALRLNLRYLQFYSSCGVKFKSLYFSLNGSTTLSELVISLNCTSCRVPENFCLPNLKNLRIGCLFTEDNFYRMVSGCPVLEKLMLIGYDFKHIVGDHCITSHFLKTLVIIGYGPYHCCISFQVPVLEELTLISDGRFNLLCDLKSLVGAYIECFPPSRPGTTELVRVCSTTTSLHLSANSILGLVDSTLQLPVFQNLTCLLIGCLKLANGLHVLASFLRINAPNLTKLILEEGWKARKTGNENFELLFPSPPACLELHIKEIQFWLWEEVVEDEIKLMEYFLENGKVLEKLVIYCDLPVYESIMNRLHKQPKIFHEAKKKSVKRLHLVLKGIAEVS